MANSLPRPFTSSAARVIQHDHRSPDWLNGHRREATKPLLAYRDGTLHTRMPSPRKETADRRFTRQRIRVDVGRIWKTPAHHFRITSDDAYEMKLCRPRTPDPRRGSVWFTALDHN